MSNTRRLFVIAVAVAAAVIALIVLKPGDDSTDRPTQTTEQTNVTGSTGPIGRASESASAKSKTEAIPLVRVRGGLPVGGPLELRVRNGERIRFRVKSDTADDVHVHGFELTVKSVAPGKDAKFDFKADIEGEYGVELHKSGAIIVVIQVRPRG